MGSSKHPQECVRVARSEEEGMGRRDWKKGRKGSSGSQVEFEELIMEAITGKESLKNMNW